MLQLAFPVLEMRSRWGLIFSPLGWGSGTVQGNLEWRPFTVLSGASRSISGSPGPAWLLSHLMPFPLILGGGGSPESPMWTLSGAYCLPPNPRAPDFGPAGLPSVTCPWAPLPWGPPFPFLGPDCPRPDSFSSTALPVPPHPLSLLCLPPAPALFLTSLSPRPSTRVPWFPGKQGTLLERILD